MPIPMASITPTVKYKVAKKAAKVASGPIDPKANKGIKQLETPLTNKTGKLTPDNSGIFYEGHYFTPEERITKRILQKKSKYAAERYEKQAALNDKQKELLEILEQQPWYKELGRAGKAYVRKRVLVDNIAVSSESVPKIPSYTVSYANAGTLDQSIPSAVNEQYYTHYKPSSPRYAKWGITHGIYGDYDYSNSAQKARSQGGIKKVRGKK